MKQYWFAALLGGASALVMAQAPHVLNAHLATEPAGVGPGAVAGHLAHVGGVQWLGYEVAAIAGSRFSVCPEDTQAAAEDPCCGVYKLEGSDTNSMQSSDVPAPAHVDVLVRISQGTVDKIRLVGAGCRVDAGGLPFTWLEDVGAQESIRWLSSLVTKDNERLGEQVMMAIAMHEAPQATATLAESAAARNPSWLRQKAAFWLGAARGHEGLLALQKLLPHGDSEFRKKLTFDVSVSRDPAAVDDLIRMARSDSDAAVREQALFWVAQKAGAKAVAALQDAVAHDPEVAVKKKAVFALSQLPQDKAVPELLHVAQTAADRAVRKEAIFWLGQTHDPRALAYFEAILVH